MTSRWSLVPRALAVIGCCLILGCGPSTVRPDPDKVQSQADYQAEMEQQEAALMGNAIPSPPRKPAEPPADAKPSP